MALDWIASESRKINQVSLPRPNIDGLSAKTVILGFLTVSAAKFLAQPLEVLKVLEQTQPSCLGKESLTQYLDSHRSLVDKIYPEEPKTPAHKLHRWHLLRQAKTPLFFPNFRLKIAWIGAHNLLTAGAIPNCLRFFPTLFVNITFKDGLEKAILPPRSSKTPKQRPSYFEHFNRSFACGGIIAALSQAFNYPLDVLRTRLACNVPVFQQDEILKKYDGTWDCLKKTVKNETIFGLYKGFWFSLASIVPFYALYFGLYDAGKFYFLNLQPEELNSSAHSQGRYFVSLGSSLIAQFVVFPLDTIRRNLMRGGEVAEDGSVTRAYRSGFQCGRILVQERGVLGLYKGSIFNIYRALAMAYLVPALEMHTNFFAKMFTK